MKKFKTESHTTYNLDTSLFVVLILSPRKLLNAARAKQTSLKATEVLPKNNEVNVKLRTAHQGCFCTLFRAITRASATSKMELFVTLLSDFQLLTNVTKNSILDVVEVLGPSLFLYVNILF